MTYRQAKNVTLLSLKKGSIISAEVEGIMTRVMDRSIRDFADANTLCHINHVLRSEVAKLLPTYKVVNAQIVHDSVTFDLVPLEQAIVAFGGTHISRYDT